jgi:hypothetical protein
MWFGNGFFRSRQRRPSLMDLAEGDLTFALPRGMKVFGG